LKHISFRLRLFVIGVVPIIALGYMIGYLSYCHARDTVTASQKGVVADTVYRTDVNLNTKARYVIEYIRAEAESDSVRELLENPDSAEAAKRLREYADNLSRSVSAVSSVSVIAGDRLLFTSADTALYTLDRTAAGNDYRDVLENPKKVYWSNLGPSLYKSVRVNEASSVLAAYSAIRGEDGGARGLIVVEMSPDSFSNLLLENQNLLEYQNTYMVDRNGYVICSNKYVEPLWRSRITQRFRGGERRFTFQWEGKPYYVCGQYNALTGWRTFSVISVENLFPQAASLRTYTAALVVVSLVLMLLSLLAVYHSFSTPLVRLSRAMKAVQDQNFELQLPNDRNDEIGTLTESFNQMVNRINCLVREVYQEKLAQKNAEIEALQAQINPHFLYNTLDSINWMAIDRDEMDISRIIVALGKLMQYSMDTEQTQVTLEQEYRHLEDYLCIQQNRLENRLQYQLELPPQVRDLLVPKLILQPLVENAIKHGIEPSQRPGLVTVRAELRDGQTVVAVQDNGRGMSAEQQRAVWDSCRNGDAASIGLRNVARRLKLFFGEDSRLDIQSTLGQGTEVSVILPASGKDREHEHSAD